MPAIATLLKIYLVFLSVLRSVESFKKVDTLSKQVIVQFTRPASGDLLAQQREGVPSETLEEDALSQKNDFISSLKSTGLNGDVLQSYSKLFNGVTLNLDNPNDINTLKTLPGVLDVFPVRTYSLDPMDYAQTQSLFTESPDFAAFKQTAHILTGVDTVHRDHPGITGKEVRVGIIDSGIDYLHPAFITPGQKCDHFKDTGCRVKFGTDFVGDDFTGGISIPQPDDDPMDCSGHGTHVAGIVGGNDEKVKGVAQGVVFGAYRVLGCTDTTTDAIVMAALDAVNDDKMKVINMSLGGFKVENSHPVAQMVDNLSQSGVIVVSSAGNDGDEGYATIKYPGSSKLGLGAASYDNSQSYGTYLKVTGVSGLDLVRFRSSTSAGIDAKFNETEPFNVIVSPQQNDITGDGCNPFQPDTFKNSVALIIRTGLCEFSDIVANAVNNGKATGVIIYNMYPGGFRARLDSTIANFPTAFIPGTEGSAIAKAAVSAGSVSVTFDYKSQVQPVTTAGLPSSLSSMGLDLSLLMKPDLGAPGGFIISSYPRALGSYTELSGTSMAAPYLAGVAALEVQRSEGTTSVLALQRRLHITAKTTMLTDSAASGKAITVAKMGAGLVDVPKFLFSTVDIVPSKLELGDGNVAKTKTITVTNTGIKAITYKISHLPSESFKAAGRVPQHLIEKEPSVAEVSFNLVEITIPPGANVPFDVTITPKDSADHVIQSGFIKLENIDDQNGGLNIPYALMTGKYEEFPLIGTRRNPALYPARISEDKSLLPFADTDRPTFDLNTLATQPAFLLELIFPVRGMDVLLVTAGTNIQVGILDRRVYVQPISEASYVLESTISDLTDLTKTIDVPDGEYQIFVNIVRPRPLTPVPNVKDAFVTILKSIPFKVVRAPTETETTVSTTATATPTSPNSL